MAAPSKRTSSAQPDHDSTAGRLGWWTIGQAMAWVGSRQPLDFDEWTDGTIPPLFADREFGPPAFGESVSRAAAAALIRQDDGIDAALSHIVSILKEAAADRRIRFRGKRLRESGQHNRDARTEEIPAADFSITSLAFFPSNHTIEPAGDAVDWSVDAHWGCVQVSAQDMQTTFPPESDVRSWMRRWAEEFLRLKGYVPFRDNHAVPAAQEACFGVNAARRAYADLPANLKRAARKPSSKRG